MTLVTFSDIISLDKIPIDTVNTVGMNRYQNAYAYENLLLEKIRYCF